MVFGERAQASVEYLLTYSMALLIMGGAIALLVDTQPEINVPEQCNVNGPFNCVTMVQDTNTTLRVLLTPTTTRDLQVGNTTLTYAGNTSTNYCQIENVDTGSTGTNSVGVAQNQQFDVFCDLTSLNGVGFPQFLPEQQEMTLNLDYKEDGLQFSKPAKVSIII